MAQQTGLEERIRLRHVKPSKMVERVETLAGLPGEATRQLKVTAEDQTDTLVIRVPASYGDHLDKERLRLLLREYVARLDQPDRKVLMHVYMVHNTLLTEEEFVTLDRELRRGPVQFQQGTTKKGVVFHSTGEYQALEFVTVDKMQAERFAKTQPDPVMVKGRILPSVREDGVAAVTLDLQATASGPTAFLDGNREIHIGESAAPGNKKPLIIVGGQRLPMADTKSEETPGRYELMVYVWVVPAKDKATPTKSR